MSGSQPTAREWIRHHSPLLVNGACLLVALWLAPLMVSGAALPVGGIVLAAVTLLFIRPQATDSTVGLWGHLWLHLRSQLATGIVCVIASRLLWNWAWPVLAFLPLWMTLTCLLEAGLLLWSRRSGFPAITPGMQTAISGALLVGITSFLFGRIADPAGLPWPTILGLAAGWLGLDRLPYARWQEAPDGRSRLTRFATRLSIWAASAGVTLHLLAPVSGRVQPALVLVPAMALVWFGLTHWSRLVAGAENNARTLLGIAVAALIHPFACHRLLGTQDAQWYMNTLADFLAQVRAGSFPVFVGQSEYLFNGGILPVRFAPLFQHYGLIVDFLTLRTLPPDALQHSVIIATYIGAAITAWAVLSQILLGRPWLIAGLSFFYLSCPGVLSIVYYDDLYMTWSVLPWLPLVFGGCVLSFRSGAAHPLVLTGGALGIIWWGHAPVALWTTLIVAVIQLTRLAGRSPRLWPWRSLLAGGAVFGAIALFPVVSVLSVPTQTTPGAPDRLFEENLIHIFHFARESFPGILVPAFGQARSISYYQPGWALLVLWGFCAGAMIRHRVKSPGHWALLAIPAGLQLLLLPIPVVTPLLWSLLPEGLVNPTGAWPMQRLYVIMAAAIVCIAAGLLPAERTAPRPTPVWLRCLLAVGLAWSAVAAASIVHLKGGQSRAIALATDLTLPENHVLTRYAYLYLGTQPAFYSHGNVDPYYEQRFLSTDGRHRIGGNPDAILATLPAGRVLGEGPLTARIVHAGDPWEVRPRFTLEPHKRYALEIHFNHGTETGVLLLTGGGLRRNYALPNYGGKYSFGSGAEASPLLPLRTSGDKPLEVSLHFAADQPGNQTDFSQFGTYRWIEIDPEALPIRVTGWIPYQAEIEAPADAWLETPRMYLPGYRATVNGRSVTPVKSPEGLVALSVPAGRSSVELSYHPPLLLLLSYWISAASILACPCLILCGTLRRRPAPSARS